MSDDDTIIHNDVPTPTYDQLLAAADRLEEEEELVLRYRQYASSVERNWFYDNKDAAVRAVKEACATGKTAEAGVSEEELDDPNNVAFAYKTLRQFTRFALNSVKNFNARLEYITEIAKWAEKYGSLLAANAQEASLQAVAMRNVVRRAFLAQTSYSNQTFDKWLHSKGHSFADILDASRARVHPERTLKDLSTAERAEVFADVIESSGRSSFTNDLLYKAEGAVGWAVLLTTLSLLVVDIVQSVTDYVSKVAEVLADAAELGAVWYGAAAAEVLAAEIFGEGAVLSIALFGFAGGVIAGFIVEGIVAAITAIIEGVFSTPERALWKEYLSQPLVYKVKLPDVDLDI